MSDDVKVRGGLSKRGKETYVKTRKSNATENMGDVASLFLKNSIIFAHGTII